MDTSESLINSVLYKYTVVMLYGTRFMHSCRDPAHQETTPHTLSGKNDRGLWSTSIVEQFASSFLAESDFIFTARMHKVSTGSNASLPPCLSETTLVINKFTYAH